MTTIADTWIQLEPSKLRNRVAKASSSSLRLVPSPYDVPEAIHIYRDVHRHTYRIDFSYIGDAEDTIRTSPYEDVTLELGKYSRRVASISIRTAEADSNSPSKSKNPFFERIASVIDGLIDAIPDGVDSNVSREKSNYMLVRDAIADHQSQILSGAA